MIFRYFVKRLRKKILFTLMGTAALCLIMLALISSFAVSGLIDTALLNFQLQTAGDADIIITTTPRGTRFFNLSVLSSDIRNAVGGDYYDSNIEYIYGHYKTFARVIHKNRPDDICTLFIGSFYEQQKFHPLILLTEQIEHLGTNEIIINEEFAAQNNLLIGDTIDIAVARSVTFTIRGIAKNEGLFYSGNSFFADFDHITSTNNTLVRLLNIRQTFTGTINKALIRVVDSNAGTIAAIHYAFDSMHWYSSLDIRHPADAEWMGGSAAYAKIGVWFAAIIITIFCIITLWVLLRLSFASDKESFKLLKSLGMSKLHIAAVAVLTVLFMGVIAVPISIVVLETVAGFLHASFIIFRGASVPIWAYFIGAGTAMFIGILCAVVSLREKTLKKPKPKTTKELNSATKKEGSITMPSIAAPVFDAVYKNCPNMLSLRLKTQSRSPLWRKFSVFAGISILVIIVMVLTVADMRYANPTHNVTFPFDIIITDIRTSNSQMLTDIKQTDGVGQAITAKFFFHETFFAGDNSFRNTLIAMDENGFSHFGADFECVQSNRAVVGNTFARSANLRMGSEFSFNAGGEYYSFIISNIIDSSFLGGRFALVDIAAVAGEDYSFTEMFVILDEAADINSAINDINYNITEDMLIFGAVNYFAFLSVLTVDIVWIVNIFGICIIVLAILTLILIIIMRNSVSKKEMIYLRPLGFEIKRRIRDNSSAFAILLMPMLLVLPLFAFILTRISFLIYSAFGVRQIMQFRFSIIAIIIAASYIAMLIIETIVCLIIREKEGVSKKNNNI